MATRSELKAFTFTGALEGPGKKLHSLSGSLSGGVGDGKHKLAVHHEDRGAPPPAPGADLQMQWHRLREELERGKEYLKQVQRQLAESRASLEKWANYEQHCGANPVPDLVQMIVADECIAAFMYGWLKRQEDKLRELTADREAPRASEGVPPSSKDNVESWQRPAEAESSDWMWL